MGAEVGCGDGDVDRRTGRMSPTRRTRPATCSAPSPGSAAARRRATPSRVRRSTACSASRRGAGRAGAAHAASSSAAWAARPSAPTSCSPACRTAGAGRRGARLRAACLGRAATRWSSPSATRGDTEETLACAGGGPGARLPAGLRRLRRRAGGARRRARPAAVRVPGGGQPRAAARLPLGAAARRARGRRPLRRTRPRRSTRRPPCCARGNELAPGGRRGRATGDNAGQGAGARGCTGGRPLVYGAGLTAPAARRWKGQINENAKAPAFWNELPELDHNELMGWTSLPHVAAVDARRVPRRPAGRPAPARGAPTLTAADLEARGVAVERVRGAGRVAAGAPVLAGASSATTRRSTWRCCTASTPRRWRHPGRSRPSWPATPAPERVAARRVALVAARRRARPRGAPPASSFPDVAAHAFDARRTCAPRAPVRGPRCSTSWPRRAGACVGLVVPVAWRGVAASAAPPASARRAGPASAPAARRRRTLLVPSPTT